MSTRVFHPFWTQYSSPADTTPTTSSTPPDERIPGPPLSPPQVFLGLDWFVKFQNP